MFKPPIEEHPILIPIILGIAASLGGLWLWVYFNYFTESKPPQAPNSIKVTASDFGADWMLTVSEGELKCEGGAISFTTSGTTYAVNGTAQGKGYQDIRPIWQAGVPPVPKKSIGPLIKKGQTLCK